MKNFNKRQKRPLPEAVPAKQVVYQDLKKKIGNSDASHKTPSKVIKGGT